MRERVNWHVGISCAIRNDLRDYADMLSYEEEYPIGNNYFRLDLLIIRRIKKGIIRKALASDFKELNLFEIKGAGSSVTINSYYKMVGLAGILIDKTWDKKETIYQDHRRYTANHITVNFISLNYPVKLISHLVSRGKSIAKKADGIYDVGGETFQTRIIVTGMLNPDDYLYLWCLKRYSEMTEPERKYIRILDRDLSIHRNDINYTRYTDQLMTANRRTGGEAMGVVVSEKLLNAFGTSSEEIRNEQKQKDLELIHEAEARADDALTQANRYRAKLIALGLDPDA